MIKFIKSQEIFTVNFQQIIDFKLFRLSYSFQAPIFAYFSTRFLIKSREE